MVDRHVGTRGEAEFRHYLIHAPVTLRARGLRREPQFGTEPQCTAHRQLRMKDVLLGDVAKRVTNLVEVLVQRPASDEDLARVRRQEPRDRLEQGRFPRAGWSDHGNQLTVGNGEADVVDESQSVPDGHSEVIGLKRGSRGLSSRRRQAPTVELQHRRTDRDP